MMIMIKAAASALKGDIRTTLHGLHPKKQCSLVLAVFVNGLT